jgi:apolipoprotein N-acyltransferase
MIPVISLSRPPVRQIEIKDYIFCILSAILLIFSFSSFNFWLLAWFGFVPLLLALQDKKSLSAFLLSYLTGIIFWWGAIYWLIHVTLLGQIILILYLALYFGIFGMVVSTVRERPRATGLIAIPSLWVLLEYIRAHLLTGFPWAILGYSQYRNLPVIQIADITGAWGVSFLVMMVNVAIYSTEKGRKRYKLAVVCLVFVLAYGFYKINQLSINKEETTLKISVIQGNIPQKLKWDKEARGLILNKYFNLSAQAAKGNPDLIIWPEAALPVVLEEEPRYYERVMSFTQKIDTPLLLGAVTSKNNLYYNSAILISAEGQTITAYNKLHLVPFGEYIPLKRILPFLETIVPIGDIAPGKDYTLFMLPVIPLSPDSQAGRRSAVNFSVLICFEDLFPELSQRFVKKGADFLVNITNDAWYKKTSAAYQHLMASVFRAIENRVFLVRSANTGVSGFIAPSGKIISLVKGKYKRNIFVDGYDSQELIMPREKSLSFYSRYGDVFILFCLVLGLYSILPLLKK